MRGRTNRSPEGDEVFFRVLSEGLSVSAACREAGYVRRTIYDWRQSDLEFRAAMDEAIEVGTDVLEDRAFVRTAESDTLTIFLLKSRRPEKYRETVRQELTGPGGGPVQTEAITHLQRAKAAASLFARSRALALAPPTEPSE